MKDGDPVYIPGTDPGFSVLGGANPPERGRKPMILANFPKNCMKLRKFWTVGGAPGAPPLDPPLEGALGGGRGHPHTNIRKTDFSRSVTKNERHTYRVNEHTTYSRVLLAPNHDISNRCKYHTFHSYI